VLVKSVELPSESSAEELARRGIVDLTFPRFVSDLACEAWLAGPDAQAGFLALVERRGVGEGMRRIGLRSDCHA
jgi:hypothetical protein